MILCHFFIPGDPVGQPRPRIAAVRAGRARVFTPATADVWKQRVALCAHQAWHGAPMNEAILVDMEFFFERPKSHYNTRGGLRTSAPVHHTAKPDIDNAFKAVADGCTGILWADDRLIVGGCMSKTYIDEAEPFSGCLLTVRRPA